MTYRGNRGRGRHDWLRLTPAYSLSVVEQLLDQVALEERVLDPFSGTATTPLAAATRGHEAVSCDINPFLIWLGETKLRRYDRSVVTEVGELGEELAESARSPSAARSEAPPIHHIERWWHADALDYLRALHAGIEHAADAHSARGRLLRVAFCRTLMALSNAAFDHPSMSFDDARPEERDKALFAARFRDDVAHILASAAPAPRRRAHVLAGDSRDLDALGDRRFDRVITSPPYPNRMSYVRELRPYMYWLGYLREAREAGELDWRAIGGTWGVATSRLMRWTPRGEVEPASLAPLLLEVEAGHATNGPLLARYLRRYFEDTSRHLRALRDHVVTGGSVHYVVGNSTFYGVLVPVEALYAELLERHGFGAVEVKRIRKRNSKKALYEFLVSARAR
ncbi:MAG: DNA methyltransferase [Deltaproteobacteria bacterium]|nr:DNA methyltransferase [Deltaproteobacteria bacterium]